ncbi:DMT family transporter [Pseudomonas sp. GM78]|uniref:DMT family transporter n=1 Tax=Pseudomonas sp. GM78 TaxID=1144337 RepID=UPI001EE65D0D|nr:multidrug efflux SMR transporter [Pseudomonas sp. GM78]
MSGYISYSFPFSNIKSPAPGDDDIAQCPFRTLNDYRTYLARLHRLAFFCPYRFHRMTYNTSWLLLIVAGFLEIFFAVGLKSANGLERPWLLVGTVVVLAGSLCLLTMALRVLPVGTAYAVWTGIGAAGTAIVGMYWLGDTVSFWRLVWIGLILLSVAGLRWAT